MCLQIRSALPTAGRKEARPALSLPVCRLHLHPSLPVLSRRRALCSLCFSSHGMQARRPKPLPAGRLRCLWALPLPLLACCFTNDDDMHVVTQLPPMDAWMDKHSELKASGSRKGSIDLGEDTMRPRSFSSEWVIPGRNNFSRYTNYRRNSPYQRAGNGS
jgi:hypothetical protein